MYGVQKQKLRPEYKQTARNNLEAIILGTNRVLYTLGYQDFLKHYNLSIIGQDFKDVPFDFNIELEILLFLMLNLKQIPGLSQSESLKQLEQTVYNLYKPLNLQFIDDIFKLSLYAIEGKEQIAKDYFLHLRQTLPQKMQSQMNQTNQTYHQSTSDRKNTVYFPQNMSFPQTVEKQDINNAVFVLNKGQHNAQNLLQAQINGEIKDQNYNPQLYALKNQISKK